MKKYAFIFLTSLSVLILVSWGYLGHQVVGNIAERHLSAKSKQAVSDLLGPGKTLGDVASWADEIRDDKTFPQHFINTPLNLTRKQFEEEVKNQPQDNVYKAMLANKAVLQSGTATHEEKERALKFIVHFVGDLHQPMHVSRKEDKGGNTIQLRFEDKGTNLHSLWDSKLLDKQGLKSTELVNKLDKASTKQIKQWQSESLMDWLWESYQLSSKIYTEIKPGIKLGDDYYQSHITIANERISKAGIRLAGLLNDILKDYKPGKVTAVTAPTKTLDSAANYCPLNELKKHIGETVGTEGKVYGFKNFESMVLLNVGAPYPNQPLTVVLRGEAKKLAAGVDGKTITILGKIMDYKGKVEIEIKDPRDIIVITK